MENGKEPTIIVAPIVTAGLALIWLMIKNKLSRKTTSMVILGLKGSGKTTMWKLLKGKHLSKGHSEPSSREKIESFEVKGTDGRKVSISATYDIGGGDDYVAQYNSLIEKHTMIYFLVDLTKLESQKAEINARLEKIVTIFNEKGIKNECGFKIVATHLDETPYTKQVAKNRVYEALSEGYRKFDIIALNLFDEYAFLDIKNEIVNAGINI